MLVLGGLKKEKTKACHLHMVSLGKGQPNSALDVTVTVYRVLNHPRLCGWPGNVSVAELETTGSGFPDTFFPLV